jgi:DNA-binding XRE family transcriptional regulator
MMVLHHCDNRLCINVDHLYLGTHHDNMRDRDSRGRQARGERNGMAHLTEQQVVEIRRLYDGGGVTQLSLAPLFNVTRRTINSIVRRETWRYLP